MRIIGLLSGKGGVGKTTSTINIGTALTRLGKNVIIIDGNLTTPNLSLQLGSPIFETDIHKILKSRTNINNAIQEKNNLKFIPGNISLDALENVRLEKFYKEIRKLDADFILVDGPAGLGKEAINIIDSCDEFIIITNPEMPAVTDALKTIKLIESMNKNVLGVLVTRKRDKFNLKLKQIENLVEKPIIGVIPEDEKVSEALMKRNPVLITHPRAKSSRAYKKLASRIVGEKYQENILEQILTIFGR